MRARKTFKNYLTSVVYSALTLITGLIATPMLIRYLGQEKLGSFRAIMDWMGYLGLLELGLGGSMLALLAASLGKNDRSGSAGTLALGIRTYLKVAGAMLIAGALLAISVTALVQIEESLGFELRAAAAILLLQFVFVPIVPIRMLAEASQEGYRVHLLLGLQSLLITVGTVVFAYLGCGLLGQAGATVLGLSVLPVFLVRYGLKRYPELPSLISSPSRNTEVESRLWKLNRETFVFDLAGKISLFSDNILVALVAGAGQVVPLTVTVRTLQILMAQLQGVGNASWAALAQLHASGERERFNDRVVEITEVIAVMGFASVIPIAAFNETFVRLWVGASLFGGKALTWAMAANAIILSLISFWAWCFTGTGKVRVLIPTWVAWAVVNFVSSVYFVYRFGIAGPVFGTLLSYLLVSFWMTPRLLMRAFGTEVRAIAMAVLKPALLGVPFAAASIWLSTTHDPGWAFLPEAGALGAAFLAIYWIVLASAKTRDQWRARVRQMLT